MKKIVLALLLLVSITGYSQWQKVFGGSQIENNGLYSSILFKNAANKVASINVKADTTDFGIGYYLTGGVYKRTKAGKTPMRMFFNYTTEQITLQYAGSGIAESAITWNAPVFTIDSTGGVYIAGLTEFDSTVLMNGHVYCGSNTSDTTYVSGYLDVAGKSNFKDTLWLGNKSDSAYIFDDGGGYATMMSQTNSTIGYSYVSTGSAGGYGNVSFGTLDYYVGINRNPTVWPITITGDTKFVSDTLIMFNDTLTGTKPLDSATGNLGNSTTGMNVVYADTLVMGGLTTIKLKISLADDATYNLPNVANVYCKVWTGANMAHYVVTTAGVVAMPVTLNSTDDADTDGVTICVYDGGTYAILKNRSGATLTFNVCIEY